MGRLETSNRSLKRPIFLCAAYFMLSPPESLPFDLFKRLTAQCFRFGLVLRVMRVRAHTWQACAFNIIYIYQRVGFQGGNMANQYRTGLVVMTKIVEHACRLITKFRPSMSAYIHAKFVAGVITSTQEANLESFLDSCLAICDVFKLITGY
jgi:hypothetical protein